MVLIFGLKIGQIFTINCKHTLIALFSGANTLAPLSHTDLPRHLRSTRRLSVCNEQIMMELQQKMHNPSSNPDGSSSKRLVRVWAIRCYWNIKFISGSLSQRELNRWSQFWIFRCPLKALILLFTYTVLSFEAS